MKTYRSPKLTVQDSKIHGKGIVAIQPIQKGEIVAIKGGEIIGIDTFRELPHEVQEFCLQVEDDFFIGSTNREGTESTAIYINHSCAPNAGLQGQITYVALCDIAAGEEITQDYAMSFTCTEAYNEMACRCGTQHCRKNITGNDWQLPELQAKYGNNFSSYILRKIV